MNNIEKLAIDHGAEIDEQWGDDAVEMSKTRYYTFNQKQLEAFAKALQSSEPVAGLEFWLYEIEKGKGVYQGCTGVNAEKDVRKVANSFEDAGQPFKVFTHPPATVPLENAQHWLEMHDAILRDLMERFNFEVWNCDRCGHAEETKDCDSANYLREYLESYDMMIKEKPLQKAVPLEKYNKLLDALKDAQELGFDDPRAAKAIAEAEGKEG